jgi:hypothetical protein
VVQEKGDFSAQSDISQKRAGTPARLTEKIETVSLAATFH